MAGLNKNVISQSKIASDLGYSQSLVSRVLNGQTGGIPDETIKAIWDHARDNGYRPRGINLDLLVSETVATQMVGFVLRSPLRLVSESQIFLHAHQGMHEFLLKKNIRTVYLGAEVELDVEELVKVMERQKLMLGVVLMGEVQPEFMATIGRCRKPVVMISARYPGVCHSVVSNLVQAANLLVEHLRKLGHRRFAWLGSMHGMGRMLRHKEAVVQAVLSAGMEIDLSCQIDMPEADRQNGYTGAAEIFKRSRRRRPTAFICHNAMMARGAVNYLFQHGYTVPKDVSVVAIDMTNVCVEEPPHITSAAAKPEALGACAAQLIIDRFDRTDHRLCEITIPSEIVVRDSSAAAAVATSRKKVRKKF